VKREIAAEVLEYKVEMDAKRYHAHFGLTVEDYKFRCIEALKEAPDLQLDKDLNLFFNRPAVCHQVEVMSARTHALLEPRGQTVPQDRRITLDMSSVHIANGYLEPCGDPRPAHSCRRAHDCAAFDLPKSAGEVMGLTPMKVAFADPQEFDSVVMSGVDKHNQHLHMGGRLRAQTGSGATWAGYASIAGQSGGGVYPLMGSSLVHTADGAVLMCGIHTGSNDPRTGRTAKHNMNHFASFSNGLPEGPEFLEGAELLRTKRMPLTRSVPIIPDARALLVERQTTAERDYRRVNNLARLSCEFTGQQRASKVTEAD